MVNNYGVIFDNLYDLYSNSSFEDYLNTIKSLDFSNKTKVIVRNKEDKDARSKGSN